MEALLEINGRNFKWVVGGRNEQQQQQKHTHKKKRKSLLSCYCVTFSCSIPAARNLNTELKCKGQLISDNLCMAKYMIMADVCLFDQLFVRLNRLLKKQKLEWLATLFVIILCITQPSGRVDILCLNLF